MQSPSYIAAFPSFHTESRPRIHTYLVPYIPPASQNSIPELHYVFNLLLKFCKQYAPRPCLLTFQQLHVKPNVPEPPGRCYGYDEHLHKSRTVRQNATSHDLQLEKCGSRVSCVYAAQATACTREACPNWACTVHQKVISNMANNH